MAFQNASNVDAHGSSFWDIAGHQIYQQIYIAPVVQASTLDLKASLHPVPDASFNRSGRVAKCMRGTREAILAKIEQWIDGNSYPPICWLSGPAGSGKSAIAQTVAEICAGGNRLAASFFFFRGSGGRSNFTHFLPTLAYQLAFSLPPTKVHIVRAVQSDPLILHRSLDHQFNKLIIDPLLAILEPILPMIVVIDAIDECDDKDSIADFIEIICRAFGDHRLPLQFFVTSRVEEHIRKKFEPSAAQPMTYQLALQDFRADADIRLFFRSRFSTIYQENRRFMGAVPQPWPSNEVLDELVDKSSGSFIFALTLVDFVNDGSDLPHHKLQTALGSHTGLDPLYRQIFSATPRSPHFDRVVGTIMLLAKPIPIADLGCLLRLETGHILHSLLGIQSVLIIPEDDSLPVRLVHTSLRDYLVSQPRSLDFYIDPPARHLCIAADCLTLISEPPENDIIYKGNQVYACLSWCHHLHQGLSEGGGNLLELAGNLTSCLVDLARRSLDFWLNTLIYKHSEAITDGLYSRLTRVPNCPQKLLQTLEYIEKRVNSDMDDWQQYHPEYQFQYQSSEIRDWREWQRKRSPPIVSTS